VDQENPEEVPGQRTDQVCWARHRVHERVLG
jgi:hypothetical protein